MIDEGSINKLLNELNCNRDELQDILSRISELRDGITALLPAGKDFRNKFIVDQKMKIFTEIIKAELDVRKQIDSSIRTEVDIRRKVEDDVDDKKYADISKIADAIEKFKKKDSMENDDIIQIECE